MPSPRPRALAALSVAALALAGCGSSDSASSSTARAPGGPITVDMKSILFAPRAATVKVGQRVTWTNSDAVAHDVTARSAGISSGTINAGGTFSSTPRRAGRIAYVCTIHPGMEGTLTVTP